MVPAELCTEKPGREMWGEGGIDRQDMLSPFCKPVSPHSLVSNGDGGGNHNTWEWSFSIFNFKIVLNT